jgi:hypothetical protein
MDTPLIPAEKHTVLKRDTNIKASKGQYTILDKTVKSYEYRLPDKKSFLVIMPWPKNITRPVFDQEARYEYIKVFGRNTQE